MGSGGNQAGAGVRIGGTRRAGERASRWAAAATVGSGLSGFLWGAGSALLLPDNLVEQTFVAFVIGGMCAASLVAFSNYLPAFIAYLFPASLPLAGPLFLHWLDVNRALIGIVAGPSNSPASAS